MTRRALFILNPAARGAAPVERLRGAMDSLSGWETALEVTSGPGDATHLAGSAAERGLDAVVACGGDGTVNEVANGLAGSLTALAVVRGGTANVWAKEVRLPKRLEDAVRLVADGETRAIDLGRAGERYFLLMAGVGFDAAIVRQVSGGLKRRLGAAAFVLHGLRMALNYPSREVDMMVDGEAQTGPLFWLLLGNTRNYAGVFDLLHQAQADDGELDMLFLSRGGLLRLGWMLPSALMGRYQDHTDVLYRRLKSLEVRTPGLAVQVDGEYVGETPMRFEVAPAALRVVVPRGLRSGLFGGQAGH